MNEERQVEINDNMRLKLYTGIDRGREKTPQALENRHIKNVVAPNSLEKKLNDITMRILQKKCSKRDTKHQSSPSETARKEW